MSKIVTILIIIIVLIIGIFLFFKFVIYKPIGMANPAAVYCIDQGGKLDIVTEASSGGEIGICNFSDGRSCEEWNFFRTKVCKN